MFTKYTAQNRDKVAFICTGMYTVECTMLMNRACLRVRQKYIPGEYFIFENPQN